MRIGIDLGGTKTEGIALDPAGVERFRGRIPTPRGDYEATLAAIVGLVREAEGVVGSATVGVGIPGAVSPATGLVKNANSTWLNGRPLRRRSVGQAASARSASRTMPTASPSRKRPTARRPASRSCSA